VLQVSTAVKCKGGKVRCSDSQTCCPAKVAAGVACCPYRNATCCADQLHCCPQNTECDSAHRRCVPRQESSLPWTKIVDESDDDLMEDENEISNRACPGGTQSCPDTYTCCAMISGGYGCCPMDGAVCCADKIHCCPKGTTCDTAGGTCKM
jgi:hypothetical protein